MFCHLNIGKTIAVALGNEQTQSNSIKINQNQNQSNNIKRYEKTFNGQAIQHPATSSNIQQHPATSSNIQQLSLPAREKHRKTAVLDQIQFGFQVSTCQWKANGLQTNRTWCRSGFSFAIAPQGKFDMGVS